MLTLAHRLPKVTGLVEDREAFLVERACGKVVLHLGCTDAGLTEERLRDGTLLHLRLAKVARTLYGVDTDRDGVGLLRRHRLGRIEELSAYEVDRFDWPELELVIAGELVEHLASPGHFFEALGRVLDKTGAGCFVTVPNAYSARQFVSIALREVEIVHPDHNCYYSYQTVATLMGRCGLGVGAVWAYSNLNRVRGMKLVAKRVMNRSVLRLRPYLAEGLILQVVRGKNG